MAIHANRGVVGIAVDSTVMTIRLRLVRMWRIPRVAGADTRENRIVRRIDMAIGTRRALVRNPEVRMVEHCPQPGGGHISSVAAYTSRRVRRGDVIRNCGAISLRVRIIRLVAAVAIRCRITRGVVAAQVTVRTSVDHRPDRARNRGPWRQHVRTLQREARRAVIKLSICPQNRVVAGRAERHGKARRNVVRDIATIRRCQVPIFQVAPAVAAIHGREAGGVVVACVAIAALHHLASRCQLMRTRQRKTRRAVIKYRRRPSDRVVARRAVPDGERRSSARVHWIVCPVVGCQVAL